MIETAAPFDWGGDLEIGDSLTDPAQRHLFRRRGRTAPAANWCLRDIVLFPQFALAFRDGEVIDATRFSVFDNEVASATRQLRRGTCFSFNGPHAYLGFNRPCVNHFHIITQIIPAIAGYQSDPAYFRGSLLLPALNGAGAASQGLIARALELIHVDISNVLRVGAHPLEIGAAVWSSFLVTDDGPSAFARSVFDCMVQHARAPAGRSRKPAIYVSRADARARPMRNEDALIRRLERCGIEPVLLSRMSLDEQIALFHDADLVIGPHGAGLANVVFCRSGAALYELLPSHYVNPCVAVQAQMRGLHYWCDVHPAASDVDADDWRHRVSWSVDVDAVERRVAAILARYGDVVEPRFTAFHAQRQAIAR